MLDNLGRQIYLCRGDQVEKAAVPGQGALWSKDPVLEQGLFRSEFVVGKDRSLTYQHPEESPVTLRVIAHLKEADLALAEAILASAGT